MTNSREYGKRVTALSRPKAHESELVDYKAKASPKDWTKKKPVALDEWAAKKAPKKLAKKAPKKPVRAKTKAVAKKKRAAR